MLIICQLVGPLSIATSFSKSNMELGRNQNLDSNQLRWLLSGHSHEMLHVYSSVVGTISASMNMKAQLILTAIAKPSCWPGKVKAEVFSYVTERQARRKWLQFLQQMMVDAVGVQCQADPYRIEDGIPDNNICHAQSNGRTMSILAFHLHKHMFHGKSCLI